MAMPFIDLPLGIYHSFITVTRSDKHKCTRACNVAVFLYSVVKMAKIILIYAINYARSAGNICV